MTWERPFASGHLRVQEQELRQRYGDSLTDTVTI